MTRPYLYLGGALCAGLGLYFSLHAPAGDLQPPSAAASLFAQSLPTPAGDLQRLAQWQGRPVIVNFWATWCAPCIEEMPALSALQTELTAGKVRILGVGIDSPSNIRQFAARYNITYPVYIAGMSGTDLARQFGNTSGSLPYTALIGADGHVVKTYLGKLNMTELRRDVATLLP